MDKRLQSEFGQCLSDLREARHMSQKALALSAGFDQSYVSGLEVGRRPPPRDRQLTRLALALKATDQELTELKTARALTIISKIAGDHEDGAERLLMRILAVTSGMSNDEMEALEVIASVLRSRHTATNARESAMKN